LPVKVHSMNPSARPRTARERDRALDRLQSITVGTAVIATMATAGFGALAAFTWSGATTDTAAADATSESAPDPTANSRLTGADEDADTLPTAEAPAAATLTPIQPTPTPVTTKKKAKVTSGGSG
jgi:hypothetical protein